MKKILIVTEASGFLPQFEMNNVKILQKMGYEVHYAANYKHVVYGYDNQRLEGTRIVRHSVPFGRGFHPFSMLRAQSCLEKILMEESFDMIHCHMPLAGGITRIAAENVYGKNGKKVPVLYTAHGMPFYRGCPPAQWLYYLPERVLSRLTDRYILVNKEDYQRVRSQFPVRGKTCYIPGVGVDVKAKASYAKTTWEIEKETSLKKEFSIPEDHAVLISVGELTNRKNHEAMIRAMKLIEDLPVTYVICGSGPLEMDLRKLAKSLNLGKRVIFTGYVTPVEKYLKDADCFVFPSKQEGLPVTVMEAMTVGLPVIGAKIRGMTDLIHHGEGGYLTGALTPTEFAKAIRHMFFGDKMRLENRRRYMGQWNQKRMRKFALPVVDGRMRRIYQDVEREFGIGEKRHDHRCFTINL